MSHSTPANSHAEPTAESAAVLLEQRRLSLALRAGAALAFAVAFLWPAMTETVLISLFAAYAFIDGVLALSPGGWGLPHRPAWPLLCGGCIDLAAAAAAYAWPGLSLVELIGLIMIWAIALATTFAVACVTLRAADEDNLFLLSGIAAALFGRALLSPMAADLVVVSTWTGLYAVTAGIVLFKLALQLYRPVAVDLSLQ